MAIQRWRFSINSRAGKLPLLSWFGYKYPFKSIRPNYLCIQELLRTYVELANFLTHLCLFKSLFEDTFLVLIGFPKLFKFSLLSFLYVFLPSPFFPTSFSFSDLFLGMGRFKSLVDSKEGIEKFKANYRIPPNVGLRYCKECEWHLLRKGGEVAIPMIAFIEGGMRILMGPMMRNYLRFVRQTQLGASQTSSEY